MEIDLGLSTVGARSLAINSRQRSDDALLLSIAQGNKPAMEALFGRHKVRVYRFGLRMLYDEAAADDLVSEVFIEVWRHAHTFQGRSQVSTWLLAIARYLAISKLRRHTTEELDEGEAELIEDSADDPETVLQTKQRNAVLAHCLKSLSLGHREIIDLIYYHGKSIREVAEVIGIPQSTVKTRMFYARSRLADLLKEFGIDRARPAANSDLSCKRQPRRGPNKLQDTDEPSSLEASVSCLAR